MAPEALSGSPAREIAASSEDPGIHANVACRQHRPRHEDGNPEAALPMLDRVVQETRSGTDPVALSTVGVARSRCTTWASTRKPWTTARRGGRRGRGFDLPQESGAGRTSGAYLAIWETSRGAAPGLEGAAALHARMKSRLGRCRDLGFLGCSVRSGVRAGATGAGGGRAGSSTEAGQAVDLPAASTLDQSCVGAPRPFRPPSDGQEAAEISGARDPSGRTGTSCSPAPRAPPRPENVDAMARDLSASHRRLREAPVQERMALPLFSLASPSFRGTAAGHPALRRNPSRGGGCRAQRYVPAPWRGHTILDDRIAPYRELVRLYTRERERGERPPRRPARQGPGLRREAPALPSGEFGDGRSSPSRLIDVVAPTSSSVPCSTIAGAARPHFTLGDRAVVFVVRRGRHRGAATHRLPMRIRE